jgi:hypothetical protein
VSLPPMCALLFFLQPRTSIIKKTIAKLEATILFLERELKEIKKKLVAVFRDPGVCRSWFAEYGEPGKPEAEDIL